MAAADVGRLRVLLTAFEAAATPPVDGPGAPAAVAGEVAAEASGDVLRPRAVAPVPLPLAGCGESPA
ncbi:hypothetical protein [Micromonospora purpureochromogenes]|uniref:Uncharacterized protein n=1 Tax=Micromonospora purpureochromogenes TaxID=47872 RepID=A0ABX2RPV8_9ACTN|nr:hypothetical protein [Micromonospora purpureochromogenes]NYF58565.1 hypothetical protein [Micromonospora purpureochromogenes]